MPPGLIVSRHAEERWAERFSASVGLAERVRAGGVVVVDVERELIFFPVEAPEHDRAAMISQVWAQICTRNTRYVTTVVPVSLRDYQSCRRVLALAAMARASSPGADRARAGVETG